MRSDGILILHDEGIVKFTSYGNLKMVELERGNQKTEKLLNALRALKREDAPNPKTDEKLPEPKRANNKRQFVLVMKRKWPAAMILAR
jgi:hypothetical protein